MAASGPGKADGWILALETCLSTASAALYLPCGDRVIQRVIDQPNKAAEHLLPEVERLLQEAGAGYGDLQAIAATNGPGSFTGVRIALASAQGMALALDCPILSLTSLQAMAGGLNGPVLALMDQARGEAARQRVDGADSDRAELCPYGDIWAGPKPTHILTAQPGLAALLPPNPWGLTPEYRPPMAEGLARQAWRVWQARPESAIRAEEADALYLRAPDAKIKITD